VNESLTVGLSLDHWPWNSDTSISLYLFTGMGTRR